MTLIGTGQPQPTIVAGLEIAPILCPKCKGRGIVVSCPPCMRRKGWKKCAKCLSSRCAHRFGIEKAKRPGKP